MLDLAWISNFFRGRVPTKSRAERFNKRYEYESTVRIADVDTIHGILTSAEQGDCVRLWALYRDLLATDSHAQAEFSKRKLAVLGDRPSIQPVDPANPDDVRAAAAIRKMIDGCPGFAISASSHLLDSALWPVSVLEKRFAPAPESSGLRFRLAELVPVPYAMLDYRTGRMQILDLDDSGRPTTTGQQPEPSRYIVHRGHLLTAPDNWGGPMRSLVFWWALSLMDRDWWGRFLERFGSPFIVGRYPKGDDQSRGILETAFAAATRLFGLVVTEDTQVELVQAASAQSSDSFERFHAVANREKSKLILGQTLSADAQSTGLGSSVGALQGKVRSDFRDFDAMALSETLRQQLFAQFLRINGIPGQPPRLVWGSESYDDAKTLADLLSSLSTAGFEPTNDDLSVLSSRLGFRIQRRAGGLVSTFSATPMEIDGRTSRSGDALLAGDRISASAAPDLGRSFAGSFAPVAAIIRESKSPAECEAKVRAWARGYRPGREADLVAEALTAFSANGLVSHEPPS